jgi:hypothetical protein
MRSKNLKLIRGKFVNHDYQVAIFILGIIYGQALLLKLSFTFVIAIEIDFFK